MQKHVNQRVDKSDMKREYPKLIANPSVKWNMITHDLKWPYIKMLKCERPKLNAYKCLSISKWMSWW